MTGLKLSTTLDIEPKDNNKKFITRGASAEFKLYLSKYAPSGTEGRPDESIKQVDFLFKQGTVLSYELYDDNGDINPGFSYDEASNCLTLLLSPVQTAVFNSGCCGYPVEFETALTIAKSVEVEPMCIIEKHMPLIVVDSLYRQSGDYEN